MEGINTRPTTDKVKESAFNILAAWVGQSDVLDLFAGTGNLGIEALSRGANSAVFVDKERASVSVIKDNLIRTRLDDRAEVIRAEVAVAFKRLITDKRYFDLIFMDPPYSKDFIPQTLELIASANLLRSDGIIMVERDKKDEIPDQVGSLLLFRNQKYGDTVLSFYKIQE